MPGLDLVLAEAAAHAGQTPWYHGIHIELEALELLIVFVLFMASLITVYYIQRWIGDY